MESEQELRARARRRAEEKVGFYFHLGAYLLVNTGLWALWFFTSRDVFPWPVFVSVFWGIGLVAHGIGTFVGDRYTESLAEKEYQRLVGRQRP